MRRVFCRIILFLLVAGIGAAEAQEAFTILSLDGSARVQRSQKRTWEKLEIGQKLNDNDLVETFFQTKLLLQFGDANLVIIGSNSKVLLNIAPRIIDDKNKVEVSLTLFSGGVFSKAINSCRINIYTANAVGVLDSGSVTTVAEGKTGETGFQALGGMVYVRNIAQQKGIELRSGLTTMIQPNKEPTAPLYITYRHVAVLKHFFGEDYIVTELDASGIKPTEERREGGGSRAMFTQAGRVNADEGMYKPQFSLNKIYGSILNDIAANSAFYAPIRPAELSGGSRTTVALATEIGIGGGAVTPRISPVCRWDLGKFSAGIRLSFVKPADDRFTAGFTSLAGILDKIEHLALGGNDDRVSLYVGALSGITFGYGLLVDRFSNVGLNNCFHPLGVAGRLRAGDVSVKLFLSDVSAPRVGGLYLSIEPPGYHFGAGYVADFNQYDNPLRREAARYSAPADPDSLYPDVARAIGGVHNYCVDFSTDLVDQYDLRVSIAGEAAQRLFGGFDGLIVRVPSLRVAIPRVGFGCGFISESGRLLSGQFDERYMDLRYRVKRDQQSGFIDTVLTPNNILSRQRRTFGISSYFRINPLRGADINFVYKQDLTGSTTLNVIMPDSSAAKGMPGDFSFELGIGINDSLVKILRYAGITLRQSHGRLFPAGGVPFLAWSFDGGYTVQFKPLFLDIAFETAGRFFYIDAGKQPDDVVEGEDFVAQFSIGLSRGF